MNTSLGVTVISSHTGSPRIMTDAKEEGEAAARAWTSGSWELYIVYAPRTLCWNYGDDVLARFLPAARRRRKAERSEDWFVHEGARDRWKDAVDYAQAAARDNDDLCIHLCATVEGGDVLLLGFTKGKSVVEATRDATRGAKWIDGWNNAHWAEDWFDSDKPRVRKMLLLAGKNRLSAGGIV